MNEFDDTRQIRFMSLDLGLSHTDCMLFLSLPTILERSMNFAYYSRRVNLSQESRIANTSCTGEWKRISKPVSLDDGLKDLNPEGRRKPQLCRARICNLGKVDSGPAILVLVNGTLRDQ